MSNWNHEHEADRMSPCAPCRELGMAVEARTVRTEIRHTSRALAIDPHGRLSPGLAAKLDYLTDAEWQELSDWTVARYQRLMDERGMVLVARSEIEGLKSDYERSLRVGP